MGRSRRTARAAGSSMETWTARFLASRLGDDRIERRAKNGSKDRGDLTGVRSAFGDRVVVEVKNTSRTSLGPWLTETATETANDDARIGVVVHKRTGKGEHNMADQFVTMSLENFARLLTPGPDA